MEICLVLPLAVLQATGLSSMLVTLLALHISGRVSGSHEYLNGEVYEVIRESWRDEKVLQANKSTKANIGCYTLYDMYFSFRSVGDMFMCFSVCSLDCCRCVNLVRYEFRSYFPA